MSAAGPPVPSRAVSSGTERQPSTTHAISHAAALARDTVPPMHPAGRPFVLAGAALSLLLRVVSARGSRGSAGPARTGCGRRLSTVTAVCTAATALFFREPRRVPPTRSDLVVAAADGTVSAVTEACPPPELGLADRPLPRVSVFLSVFDVHVQRVPISGRVERIAYRRGTFLSADLDKASEQNERNTVLMRADDGQQLAVVQIAGLVARRIQCQLTEGEQVAVGQTYGLIRFGSRVDVYLPAGSQVLVREGQRAIGGETALAKLPADARPGETSLAEKG